MLKIKEDFPVPLDPHNSPWFEGLPSAKRIVFSKRTFFCFSMNKRSCNFMLILFCIRKKFFSNSSHANIFFSKRINCHRSFNEFRIYYKKVIKLLLKVSKIFISCNTEGEMYIVKKNRSYLWL